MKELVVAAVDVASKNKENIKLCVIGFIKQNGVYSPKEVPKIEIRVKILTAEDLLRSQLT